MSWPSKVACFRYSFALCSGFGKELQSPYRDPANKERKLSITLTTATGGGRKKKKKRYRHALLPSSPELLPKSLNYFLMISAWWPWRLTATIAGSSGSFVNYQ